MEILEVSAEVSAGVSALAGLRALVIAVLACGMVGCLEFDEQEVVFHYDRDADRFDVLFLYQGLHVDGADADDLEHALKHVDQISRNGKFAFLQNWPLAVNPSDRKNSGFTMLAQHVDVETGGLFTDLEGRLCGYQFVRVRQASKLLKTINGLLTVGLRKALGDDEFEPALDPETRQRVQDFLDDRESLLTMDDASLHLTMPTSAAYSLELRSYLLREFLSGLVAWEGSPDASAAASKAKGVSDADAAKPPATVASDGDVDPVTRAMNQDATARNDKVDQRMRFPVLQLLAQNEVGIRRIDGATIISLGAAGAERFVLRKPPQGDYETRLLDELRKRASARPAEADGAGHQIEDSVPIDVIHRRFEEFRGRDVELAPDLAAARKR